SSTRWASTTPAREPSRSTGGRPGHPSSRPSWSWRTSTRCSRPRTCVAAAAAAPSSPRSRSWPGCRKTSAGNGSFWTATGTRASRTLARVLIVGCGCRGRELAAALLADGHAARGTTRRPEALGEIRATGAQAVVADPDRLSTILPQLDGVSALCWLMGAAVGDRELIAAIHGPRLETLLERLVDTPVRGVVYEGAGPVQRASLDRGATLVRAA